MVPLTIGSLSRVNQFLSTPEPQTKQPAKKFSNVMSEIAEGTVNVLREGEKLAMKGVVGAIPTEEVVASIMATERTLNTAIAVRDKAVSAYQEIIRMQL